MTGPPRFPEARTRSAGDVVQQDHASDLVVAAAEEELAPVEDLKILEKRLQTLQRESRPAATTAAGPGRSALAEKCEIELSDAERLSLGLAPSRIEVAGRCGPKK